MGDNEPAEPGPVSTTTAAPPSTTTAAPVTTTTAPPSSTTTAAPADTTTAPPFSTTTAPGTTTTAAPETTTTEEPGITTTEGPGTTTTDGPTTTTTDGPTTTTTEGPGTTTTDGPGTTTTDEPGEPKLISVEVAIDPDDGSDPHAHSIQAPTDAMLTLTWSSENATSVDIDGLGSFGPEGSETLPTSDASYSLVAKSDDGSASAPWPLEVHTHEPGEVVSQHVDVSSGEAVIISFTARKGGEEVSDGKVGDSLELVLLASDGCESARIDGTEVDLSTTSDGHKQATTTVVLTAEMTGAFEAQVLKEGEVADTGNLEIEIAPEEKKEAPAIVSFVAVAGDGVTVEGAAATVTPGSKLTLNLEVTGEGAKASIDNGVGEVSLDDGKGEVEVTPQFDDGIDELTYQLSVSGTDPDAEPQTATVTVKKGSGEVAATLQIFAGSEAPEGGTGSAQVQTGAQDPIALRWTASGAARAVLHAEPKSGGIVSKSVSEDGGLLRLNVNPASALPATLRVKDGDTVIATWEIDLALPGDSGDAGTPALSGDPPSVKFEALVGQELELPLDDSGHGEGVVVMAPGPGSSAGFVLTVKPKDEQKQEARAEVTAEVANFTVTLLMADGSPLPAGMQCELELGLLAGDAGGDSDTSLA